MAVCTVRAPAKILTHSEAINFMRQDPQLFAKAENAYNANHLDSFSSIQMNSTSIFRAKVWASMKDRKYDVEVCKNYSY